MGPLDSRPPSTTAKRPDSAHHERRFLSTSGLAVLSARHPWRVLGIWLVIILLALVAASGLSDSLSTTSEFTGQPESAVGEQLLTDRLPAGNPISETIVIRSETIAVSDPAFKTVVDRVSANLAGLGDLVVSAPTYYQLQASSSPSADQLISADRHTTIIPVTFKGTYDEVNKHTDAYLNAVKSADGSDVRVLTVGSISANKEFNNIRRPTCQARKISLPITMLILVVVFGALVAAGVPWCWPSPPSLIARRTDGAARQCHGSLVLRGEHGHHDRIRGRHRLRPLHHLSLPRGAPPWRPEVRGHRRTGAHGEQGGPLLWHDRGLRACLACC